MHPLNEQVRTERVYSWLRYYFRTVYEKAGLKWTYDNDAEMRNLAEEITR